MLLQNFLSFFLLSLAKVLEKLFDTEFRSYFLKGFSYEWIIKIIMILDKL